jgi:hypothetical protein
MTAFRVHNLRRIGKPGLIAFGDIELPSGMILIGCAWRDGDKGKWVALPTRSYVTKDGEVKWTPTVEFVSTAREAKRRFQAQALEAFRAVAGAEAEL